MWCCHDFASNHIEFQLVSKDHDLLVVPIGSSRVTYPPNIRILVDVSVKHSLNHRYSYNRIKVHKMTYRLVAFLAALTKNLPASPMQENALMVFKILGSNYFLESRAMIIDPSVCPKVPGIARWKILQQQKQKNVFEI